MGENIVSTVINDAGPTGYAHAKEWIFSLLHFRHESSK